MKLATMVLAMMAVLGMVSVTMAKTTTGKVSGTFERMQGETIIVSHVDKDGTKIETPVVSTKDTTVMIDGAQKTLADLTQGMRVKILTPNGLATQVIVKSPKAKTKAPATQPSSSDAPK